MVSTETGAAFRADFYRPETHPQPHHTAAETDLRYYLMEYYLKEPMVGYTVEIDDDGRLFDPTTGRTFMQISQSGLDHAQTQHALAQTPETEETVMRRQAEVVLSKQEPHVLQEAASQGRAMFSLSPPGHACENQYGFLFYTTYNQTDTASPQLTRYALRIESQSLPDYTMLVSRLTGSVSSATTPDQLMSQAFTTPLSLHEVRAIVHNAKLTPIDPELEEKNRLILKIIQSYIDQTAHALVTHQPGAPMQLTELETLTQQLSACSLDEVIQIYQNAQMREATISHFIQQPLAPVMGSCGLAGGANGQPDRAFGRPNSVPGLVEMSEQQHEDQVFRFLKYNSALRLGISCPCGKSVSVYVGEFLKTTGHVLRCSCGNKVDGCNARAIVANAVTKHLKRNRRN